MKSSGAAAISGAQLPPNGSCIYSFVQGQLATDGCANATEELIGGQHCSDMQNSGVDTCVVLCPPPGSQRGAEQLAESEGTSGTRRLERRTHPPSASGDSERVGPRPADARMGRAGRVRPRRAGSRLLSSAVTDRP